MKKIAVFSLICLLLFVSCATSETPSVTYSEIVPYSQKEVVIEQEVNSDIAVEVILENLAEEVIEEAEVAKTVVYQPIAMTYALGDYKADIFADVGEAEIVYPKQFSEKEVYNAIVGMAKNYQSQLKDVFFKVENGKIYLTYPETYGVNEFKAAEEILTKELTKLATPSETAKQVEIFTPAVEQKVAVNTEVVSEPEVLETAETVQIAEVAEVAEAIVSATASEEKALVSSVVFDNNTSNTVEEPVNVKKGLSAFAIIMIVVVSVALILCLVYFLVFKKKNR